MQSHGSARRTTETPGTGQLSRLAAAILAATLGAAAVVGLGPVGCGSWSPREVSSSFTMPPPIGRSVDLRNEPLPDVRRSNVVIGTFENPRQPDVRWADVGEHVSRLIQRNLAGDRRFNARLDAGIGRSVDKVLFEHGSSPREQFESIVRAHPDVDYVITGRVTDFHHTADLPEDVSRRNLLGRRRNEAVVAFEAHIVDLHAKRVIVTEDFVGVTSARGTDTDEIYAGLALESYLFRNTPLGRAGDEAVDRLVRRMDAMAPLEPEELRIVELEGRRRVTIVGGREHGVSSGQQYYVYTVPEGRSTPEPVMDPALGRPLAVRIDHVRQDWSTAWLLGEPPEHVNLRSTVLSRRPPQSGRTTAVAPTDDQ